MSVMSDAPVFSVGEFLDFINELIGQQDFYVQGEVAEAKALPSGLFFTLKDQETEEVMGCYMSPHAYRGLGLNIEAGMRIKIGGVPSVYKPKGRFSFRAETAEPIGEGSLKKAYEALKKKLAEEGLFGRKRPLPEYIARIGLITSKTGAVIDDFRRNLVQLGLTVYHRDVRVEGAAASEQIVGAIREFDREIAPVDVLVIIRGGGSAEDLQAFNNEPVVRAVFGARASTIVSIGHDRDVPLAQMAADASASTPTAAAMLVNASWDRASTVDQIAQKIRHAGETMLASAHADVGAYTHRMATHLARLAGYGKELDRSLGACLGRVGDGIARARQAVNAAERHIATASPERHLRLGYSIVSDMSGAVIRAATQLRQSQAITTRLAEGSFISEVKEVSSD